MTFTYDPTDDIGKVRRLVGDTVSAEAELTDEEIEAWLTDHSDNHEKAAISILRQLQAKYAKRATISSGNEKIELGKISDNYSSLISSLERSIGTTSTLTSRRVERL
jgi:hypothetical protein